MINNFDIPDGQAYKIGGVHVLSTPVQASSIALGNTEPVSQGPGAVAVGINSGVSNQDNNAIAIGTNSGQTDQGDVAVGSNTVLLNQGSGSVAVGRNSGSTNQGINSIYICIGENTQSTGFNGTIVLGVDALAGVDSEFVIGSDTVPVLVYGSSGPLWNFFLSELMDTKKNSII